MPRTDIGARSATGRRRKPLGWLPWVVALILALVIAAVVVLVVANDDDNSPPASAPSPALDISSPSVAA